MCARMRDGCQGGVVPVPLNPSPAPPPPPPPQVMGLMGAKVEWSPYSIKITGPAAFGRPLRAIDHDCNDIPDAAMTAAVAALYANGCEGQ